MYGVWGKYGQLSFLVTPVPHTSDHWGYIIVVAPPMMLRVTASTDIMHSPVLGLRPVR